MNYITANTNSILFSINTVELPYGLSIMCYLKNIRSNKYKEKHDKLILLFLKFGIMQIKI